MFPDIQLYGVISNRRGIEFLMRRTISFRGFFGGESRGLNIPHEFISSAIPVARTNAAGGFRPRSRIMSYTSNLEISRYTNDSRVFHSTEMWKPPPCHDTRIIVKYSEKKEIKTASSRFVLVDGPALNSSTSIFFFYQNRVWYSIKRRNEK